MKRLIPFFILVIACLHAFSQNWDDALRYSQTFAGGTARSTAMGGAFGALGADFSSASQNPAGLGFYRTSEFTFSPEFNFNRVDAKYKGDLKEENKFSFNVNNLSYVMAFKNKKEKGFIGGSFGIGYNKINNFNSNIYIEGVNNISSLADHFVETANYYSNLDPFSDGLFFDTYLIDSINGSYYKNPDMLLPGKQRKTINRSGKMNEWDISAGFNISHMVYFGASLGIIPVYSDEKSIFDEYNESDPGSQYFSYTENRNVRGNGYKAIIGIIFRPITMLRIGGAFHTPTVYKLNQSEEIYIKSQYYNNFAITLPYDHGEIDHTSYDYQLITPLKLVGSLGISIGKVAIISADLEYIDYSSMRLRDGEDVYNFADENQGIEDIYRDNFNLKTGAEVRLGTYYIRGGFGYYGSPYKSGEINEDAYRLSYGGGVGYRQEHFFIDMTLNYTNFKEVNNLYSVGAERNLVSLDNTTTRFITTIGFRF
jgi:hypothetical protein